jgi:hypothetical protein
MKPILPDWRRLLPVLRRVHQERPIPPLPADFSSQVMAAVRVAPQPQSKPILPFIRQAERTVWQAAVASCALALGLLVATGGASIFSGEPVYAWMMLTEPAVWLGLLPMGL